MQLGFRKGEEKKAQNRARRLRLQAQSLNNMKSKLAAVSNDRLDQKHSEINEDGKDEGKSKALSITEINKTTKLVAISKPATNQDFLNTNSQISEDIKIQKIEDRIQAIE